MSYSSPDQSACWGELWHEVAVARKDPPVEGFGFAEIDCRIRHLPVKLPVEGFCLRAIASALWTLFY